MIFTALRHWQLIGIGLALFACAVLYGLWQHEKAERLDLVARHAQALAAAQKEAADLQHALDGVSLKAADTQVIVQTEIVETTKTIVKEIPHYVPDTSSCITVGLVRVLDAAARGADPETLPLAPGQFNETCADVRASDLARNVAENYGRAHGNAAQLTGLQDWVRGTAAALAAAPAD